MNRYFPLTFTLDEYLLRLSLRVRFFENLALVGANTLIGESFTLTHRCVIGLVARSNPPLLLSGCIKTNDGGTVLHTGFKTVKTRVAHHGGSHVST